MAKKISAYPIQSFSESWERNPKDGLPQSGAQVRKFLGDQITAKHGGVCNVDDNLYFFASKDAAERFLDSVAEGQPDYSLVVDGPIPVGGSHEANVDFRIQQLQTGNIYINGKNPYYFPLYVKSVVVEDEQENPYDVAVNIDVEVTLNGVTTVHPYGSVEANTLVRINVAPYVSNGAALRVKAYNDRGNSRTTASYAVTRANMSVEPDADFWTKPYIFGEDWSVPLAVSCNVAAQLRVTMTDAEGVTRASKVIPSSQMGSRYDLLLDHPSLNNGIDGLYTLTFEMVATDESLAGLAADIKTYRIVCLHAENAQNFIIVNNEGTDFRNYATNRMFDYAVIVGYGNPSIRITAKDGDTILSDSGSLAVQGGKTYTYSLPLEMDRIDDTDFPVDITLSVDDGEDVTKQYTFSNKGGFAAVAGANLLIKMQGRSNTEEGRETFRNMITGEDITAEWNGMTWTSADGYLTERLSDGTDQSFLRLLAGSNVTLPVTLTNDCTLELDFRVRNVLDYDSEVIRCLNVFNDTFHGLKVTPNKIEVRTSSAQKSDDQSVNYDAENHVHLTLVFRTKSASQAVTADNYTGVLIYIDGCKQRAFFYDGILSGVSGLTIGSDSADVDLFAVRYYPAALTNAEIETNAANWRPTEAEKREYVTRNNVREEGEVDINKVRSLCNVVIFETEGDVLPDISWAKEDSVKADIKMHFLRHPDWDWTLHGVSLAWQGTTSHGYLRQNFKAKAASNFDADGGTHAKCKSLTFKKNFASSMQSHKMGSVNSYTDLARKCGVLDEDERASIWQYPAVGFQKMSDGTYRFIGLYTWGPDKGDSNTFGFGDDSIAMEGSDNEPAGTNFRLPWNADTVTIKDNETYSMCGVKSWEDSQKHPELVEQYWKPAYNFVYGCAQNIALVESAEQLENLDTSMLYAYDGQVFYHNGTEWATDDTPIVPEGEWETIDDIKALRKAYFKAHAADYFDIRNALFHLGFIEFHGASDNLAKNTYPYIKQCGVGKIQWRQDDLDTIFDIENQGKAYKQYCVEIGDNYAMYGRPAQSVFNGTGSQFWLLLRECFANEYYAFMRDVFIPALHYGQTADAMTMVMAHFEHYYFDAAQEHFPAALYNEDAKYCYEEAALTAKVGNTNYGYQSIALSQLLGNHYSAERYWVKMRYIYMASKYTADNFAMGAQDDTFRTRPYNPDGMGNTFMITPAIYMYPSVQEGNTKVTRGERIFPGNPEKTWTVTLNASADSDQEQRVNGMSYIRSLGPMYADAFTGSITVNGKMLTSLDLGTRTDTDNIRSVITGVTIGDAVALRSVELSNLTTMQGVQDFSVCAGLRELYAENTNVTSVPLADGGLLHTLHLPASLTTLVLHGKKQLADLTIEDTANVVVVDIEECSDIAYHTALDIVAKQF